MSITTDLKTYAGTALAQGKQVAESVATTAEGFVGVARVNVAELTDRAADTFADLRQQASTTLNLDAVRAAVEPYVASYVAQAKGYSTVVTERAEELITTVSSDPRVARVLAGATTLSAPVVEAVQERVVAPVRSYTRREAAGDETAVTTAADTAVADTTVADTAAPAPSTATAPTAPRARKAPAKKATPPSA